MVRPEILPRLARPLLVGGAVIEEAADVSAIRSCTSVCLKIVAPWVAALSSDDQAKVPKSIVAALEKEKVAYDIDAYRDAPPGMRIWAGATVEKADLEAGFVLSCQAHPLTERVVLSFDER